MATDRIIRWASIAVTPTPEALGAIACDYSHGLAISVEWDGQWVITLPGESHSATGRSALIEPGWKRRIEVWRSASEPVVYVMTRSADEITSAVAEGLAALVARQWGGTREC